MPHYVNDWLIFACQQVSETDREFLPECVIYIFTIRVLWHIIILVQTYFKGGYFDDTERKSSCGANT